MIQIVPLFRRSRRILSTNEIVDVLENLGDDYDFQGVDIYLEPPCGGTISDGDSEDEDGNDIANFNRHQLLAPAEMVMQQSCSNEESEDHEADQHLAAVASTSRGNSSRQRRTAPSRPRKWIKRDLVQPEVEWSVPLPRSVITISAESEPIEFFELFFDLEVIRHIVRHTVMYAFSKDPNISFTLSADEIYCFIGILILTGYAPLPRRRMYWELNEDTHNVLVSKSMRRNRFEEIFRYLHVADNNNLRPDDNCKDFVVEVWDC